MNIIQMSILFQTSALRSDEQPQYTMEIRKDATQFASQHQPARLNMQSLSLIPARSRLKIDCVRKFTKSAGSGAKQKVTKFTHSGTFLSRHVFPPFSVHADSAQL